MVSDYELKFGKLCIKMGLLTREQVQWAFAMQQNNSPNKGLAQILADASLLTREQVGELVGRIEELERATMVMPSADPLIGRVLGRCVLQQVIGRGGMGTVYKARHKTLNCPFAVKVMPSELETLDPSYVKRFVHEARMAARINHHNIVRVIDVGRNADLGRYYIVMEYVDGDSVGAMLRKRGKLPLPESLRILRDGAEALRVAAAADIVHRDIKPDNLIVTRTGETKLADLGLGKHAGAQDLNLTLSGISMGTPYYMSPEQARDARTADTRSDIYSLGATFYHMVTGKVPFSGRSAYEVLAKHENDPLPDPRAYTPELPDSVCAMVARMMAKRPEDRYQTPEELLRDLRQPEMARIEAEGLAAADSALQRDLLTALTTETPAHLRPRTGLTFWERAVVEGTAFALAAGAVIGLSLLWQPLVLWTRGVRAHHAAAAPAPKEAPPAEKAPETGAKPADAGAVELPAAPKAGQTHEPAPESPEQAN